MYLKDDAAEFVEQEKIKNLVKKYSEFINYPIKLYLSKDVREQVEVDADGNELTEEQKAKNAEAEAEAAEKKEGDEDKVTDEGETDPAEEGEKPEKKTKTVTK